MRPKCAKVRRSCRAFGKHAVEEERKIAKLLHANCVCRVRQERGYQPRLVCLEWAESSWMKGANRGR